MEKVKLLCLFPGLLFKKAVQKAGQETIALRLETARFAGAVRQTPATHYTHYTQTHRRSAMASPTNLQSCGALLVAVIDETRVIHAKKF